MSKKRKHIEENNEELVIEAGSFLKHLLKLTVGLVMYKLGLKKKFPEAPTLTMVPRKQSNSDKSPTHPSKKQ